MAKIFLVLTLIAAGFTIWFGLETKQQIGVVQDHLDKTKKELASTKSILVSTQLTLADTNKKLDQSTKDLAAMTEKEKGQEDLVTTLTAQVGTLNGQITTLNGTIDDLKKQLAVYQTPKPGSNNPINPWEAKIAEMQKHIDELTITSQGFQKRAEDAEKHVQELVDKETARVKALLQPGVEGIVMAVNPGYSFAVVSVGDKQGAVPNGELLVKRGNVLIARLKITTVEPVLSVADIIPDSVSKGQRVLPGDKVIFTGKTVDQ